MASAMSTTRLHPLFWRKLLLLSAYILVASAKISTAPFLASGSPDKLLSTQPKIIIPIIKRLFGRTKETHQPMTDFTQAVALRLRPFHNKIDFKVANMYNTRVFKKVTDKVMSVHSVGTDPMASVFDGILQAAGPEYKTRGLGELFRQIMYFKNYPQDSSLDLSFLPITSADKAINDLNWCKKVFCGLEPHLLNYWKSEGLTRTDLNELLKVDVTSSAFFDDEVILPRIRSFQKQTRKVLGNSFDLVLNVYKESLSDIQIATMLFANSEIKETKTARSLMKALFRDWTRRKVAPEALLLELVPSLDKNDFLSLLNVWVMYFKSLLKEQLYPTLVRTLVKADVKSTRLRETSNMPRDIDKELALVDIIAAEWSKELDFHSSRTQGTPSSPLANPIFFALCSFWKEHRAKFEDMSVLLNIQHKNPLVQVARRRAWMTYMIVSGNSDATISLLYITLTEKELLELIARVVDWDKEAYKKLSKPLFDKWSKDENIRQKVFADLEVSGEGFQNRLLTVWNLYTREKGMDRANELLLMRKLLEKTTKAKNFEMMLTLAVHNSNGEQQRTLFELLVIPTIVEGKREIDAPGAWAFIYFRSKKRDWYEDLEKSIQTR